MRKKIFNFNKGFTIVELLMYMGIFTILTTVLTDIFVSALNTKLESQATSYVQQDGRFIMERLSFDIHRVDSNNGDTIVIPASLGASGSTLQLRIGGVNYTYSLSGTDLQLNSENVNGYNTSISNLTFKRLGNVGSKDTIQVSFQISSKVLRNGASEVKTYQTTIGIR